MKFLYIKFIYSLKISTSSQELRLSKKWFRCLLRFETFDLLIALMYLIGMLAFLLMYGETVSSEMHICILYIWLPCATCIFQSQLKRNCHGIGLKKTKQQLRSPFLNMIGIYIDVTKKQDEIKITFNMSIHENI